MKSICFIALIFSSSLMAGTPIITVGDVNDSDCDFNDLQTAIDSINIESDIRVTNTISSTSGINVFDKKLRFLKGGYNSCIDTIQHLDAKHSISNPAGNGLSVSIADANITSISISGFDIHDSEYGIKVNNGIDDNVFELNLSRISIFDNSKTGINSNGISQGIALSVVLDDANIYNNQNIVGGSTQGGGIRCVDTNFTIARNVAIHDNQAGIGAGIFNIRCRLILHAGGYFEDKTIEFGIFNNIAEYGGGLYIGGESTVNGSGSELHPLIISNNQSTNETIAGGGGIYYAGNTSTILSNVHINNNSARYRGAALFGRFSGASLTIDRSATGCQYEYFENTGICSLIKDNQLEMAAGNGAAIYLKQDAIANIYQTEISKNQANKDAFAYIGGGATQLNLEDNLIINNKGLNVEFNSSSLIGLEYGGGLYSAYNTFADNAVSTVFDLNYSDGAIPNYLTLYKEIIANSPATIIDMDGGENDHDVYLDCSIIHDNSYGMISGASDTQIGSPSFIGNDNYLLQVDSIAINKVCSVTAPSLQDNLDIRGYDRSIDGQSDAGAYEINVSDDVIFQNGLE